ncbi:hypothetical protein [Seleniivibrio woodruffii]|uniref:hypothetical protein n=1 Tax=Seleniivibrio woodruffii TaxID=1078050 RepID=UPI002409B90E|nr:hypothetical protein [Seleniivibrio woodruffii]
MEEVLKTPFRDAINGFFCGFHYFFLIVSTVVVVGRLIASFTGINWPVFASLPIFVLEGIFNAP